MSQQRAGQELGIGVRQVKRLVKRLVEARIELIEAALPDRYGDFGATLAAEKLSDHEGITVSKVTVRQIQIRLGLLQPKRRLDKRMFQVRECRPRFGELIQIDGSHHAWLKDREPKCTLIVFIDDAIGQLTGLSFSLAETTRAYLDVLRSHVLANGIPLAFYSDRHGIFRTNSKELDTADGLTAFGRVIGRLGIEQICASTPQAKGRVEGANQTLQDCLIKELWLEEMSDYAAA